VGTDKVCALSAGEAGWSHHSGQSRCGSPTARALPRPLDAADCVAASRRALLTGRSRVAGGELSVNTVGFGELIFQDDDATGGFQRVALVD
jgi:hypothetical protein